MSESEETPLEQIGRLANFIMAHVKGEPSRNEGAVDCAIRLLRERNSYKADIALLTEQLRAWEGQPDVWERVENWLFNCQRHIRDF